MVMVVVVVLLAFLRGVAAGLASRAQLRINNKVCRRTCRHILFHLKLDARIATAGDEAPWVLVPAQNPVVIRICSSRQRCGVYTRTLGGSFLFLLLEVALVTFVIINIIIIIIGTFINIVAIFISSTLKRGEQAGEN